MAGELDVLYLDLNIFSLALKRYITFGFPDKQSKREALLELYTYYRYLHENYGADKFVMGSEIYPLFVKEFCEKENCESLTYHDIDEWDLINITTSKKVDVPTEALEKLGVFRPEDIQSLAQYEHYSLEELKNTKKQLRLELSIAESKIPCPVPEANLKQIREFISTINYSIREKPTPAKKIPVKKFSEVFSKLSISSIEELFYAIEDSKLTEGEQIRELILKALGPNIDLENYRFELVELLPRAITIKVSKDSETCMLNFQTRATPKANSESLANDQIEVYTRQQFTVKDTLLEMVITEPTKNLLDAFKDKTPTERYEFALKIYPQMATIMDKAYNDGLILSSANSTYWLIDESGQLKIADNIFIKKTPAASYSQAEEYDHAYHRAILARNLYQSLTDADDEYLDFILGNLKEPKYLDFTYPLFFTEQGLELKKLILDLANPNTDCHLKNSKSFTTRKAATKLQELAAASNLTLELKDSTYETQKECNSILAFIMGQKNAAEIKDPSLTTMVNSLIRKMKRTNWKNKEESLYTYQSLTKAQSYFNSEQSCYVMDLIKKFHDEGEKENFSIGKKRKAKRIAEALVKIPLENRDKALEDPEVLKAIQSHRKLGFGQAKSFFSAKQHLVELKNKEATKEEKPQAGPDV